MPIVKKDFVSPDNPILLLSAKNFTTAKVAETDGVKDLSGNDNHGQAYGGLTIPTGEDEFSFDGTDDYINIAGSKFSSINNVEGVTLFCRFKCSSSISDGTRNLITISLNGSSIGLAMRLAISNGAVNLSYGGRSHDTSQSAKMNSPATTLNKNQWYSCAVVASTANHVCTAYIDSLEFASITTWHTEPFVTPNSVKIGSQSGSNNFFKGSISDVRIYPRALTADEVRYIHNNFQSDLRFGQKTPKKIMLGSNEARKLYYGESLVYTKTKDYLWPKTFTRTQLSQTTLSSPSRAAFISPEGNMFATDWSGKCVKIFDSTGTYVRSFTPLSGKIPYGINGDASYLYVTYWDSPKIYKYQYSGTDVPTLKNTWTTSYQYNNGTDVYNGYLYVACAYAHVIMKIDVSSGTVTEIPTGTTYDLNDLAIDKVNSRIVTTQNGGVYNGIKGHIIIYDMSGNLLVDKEMNGTYDSKMDSPQGVAVDASGYIYLGGAYTSTGSYNQGFMVMDKNLNILYDVTMSECPTFCFTFNYDSYHNRVVWVGTSYGGSSPYIYGIDL